MATLWDIFVLFTRVAMFSWGGGPASLALMQRETTSAGWVTSEEFAQRLLLEEKVAVVPGPAFGQCGEGYIRCCYATSLEDIEEALRRMERFIKRHT